MEYNIGDYVKYENSEGKIVICEVLERTYETNTYLLEDIQTHTRYIDVFEDYIIDIYTDDIPQSESKYIVMENNFIKINDVVIINMTSNMYSGKAGIVKDIKLKDDIIEYYVEIGTQLVIFNKENLEVVSRDTKEPKYYIGIENTNGTHEEVRIVENHLGHYIFNNIDALKETLMSPRYINRLCDIDILEIDKLRLRHIHTEFKLK